jgi:hypothetical protein
LTALTLIVLGVAHAPFAFAAAHEPVAQSPAVPVLSADGAVDALDEVNAARAAAGLPPLVRDPALTAAAAGAASFRARARLFGHTSNDFAFLPAGGRAISAGCAAYPSALGWRSCCTYEGYTHGGAAYAVGEDGRRYMHLFVDRRPMEAGVVPAAAGEAFPPAGYGYRESYRVNDRVRTVGRSRWR